MNKYMSITDKASEVRKALKEEMGLSNRKVSVRGSYCGYSDALDITIKDLMVDIKKVELIANRFYDVDRCERSGEILQGGNTYVTVRYDWEKEREHEKKYNTIADMIYKEFEEERKTGSCKGWTIAKATRADGDDVNLVYYPSADVWGMAEICNVPFEDKIRVCVHSEEGLKMALSKFKLYVNRKKHIGFTIVER